MEEYHCDVNWRSEDTFQIELWRLGLDMHDVPWSNTFLAAVGRDGHDVRIVDIIVKVFASGTMPMIITVIFAQLNKAHQSDDVSRYCCGWTHCNILHQLGWMKPYKSLTQSQLSQYSYYIPIKPWLTECRTLQLAPGIRGVQRHQSRLVLPMRVPFSLRL